MARDKFNAPCTQDDVKKAFTGGNTHAVFVPVTHDVESFDPDEKQYLSRMDFYSEHCRELNNLDISKNYCIVCKFCVFYTGIDGSLETACNLEEEWRKVLQNGEV